MILHPQFETEAQRLDALAYFCIVHGAPHCYKGWPMLRLRQYLAFHDHAGTLAVARAGADGRIVGTAVAWRDHERLLRSRRERGDHAFQWQPNNPRGDCVFVADVVCTVPGALAALIGALVKKFPTWRGLKILTFRPALAGEGIRWVEYPQRLVDRLLRERVLV